MLLRDLSPSTEEEAAKPVNVEETPGLPPIDDDMSEWANPNYEMPAKYAADPNNSQEERRDWSYHEAKGDMTRQEWNSGAFKTGKGTIDDLGGFVEDPKTTWEGALAPFTGVADAAIGTYNMLTPGPDIPQIPQFENEGAQFMRDVSSILIPGAGWARGIQGLGALGAASAPGRVSRFLTNPVVQKGGNWSANLGGGALGDLFAPIQGDPNGQTLLGAAKETFPRWMGFIPDDLTIQDGDSLDTIRSQNVAEGALFQGTGGFIAGLGKLQRGLRGVDTATSYLPKNELASNYFAKNQPVNPATADELVSGSALRAEDELLELGELNTRQAVEKAIDIESTSIFGKDLDLFDVGENVIRSSDDMGIVGAAVDQTRIAKNIDTAYGRVRNPMSEAALKFTLESGQAPRVISQLGDALASAGKYDVKLPSGKTVKSAQIEKQIDELSANMLNMDMKDLKKLVGEVSTMKDGLPILGKVASKSVNRVLEQSLSQLGELARIDNIRALALTEAAFAGQVSDFAQSLRLQDGRIGQFRAMEQMLDRIEFLQDIRGMSAIAKNGLERTKNIWQRFSGTGPKGDAKYAQDLAARMQGGTLDTLEAIETVQRDTHQFMQSLRAINQERPNFLRPMATIYELTDGDARSVAVANNYLRNRFGVMKKAFYDNQPEIPSVMMQGFWSTMFNSALSGVKTPLKAGASNLSTWVLEPTTQIAGAYLNHGRGADLTRAMYSYGSVLDTMQKGGDYMKTMWVRSAQDPSVLRGRDEIVYKTTDDMELAKELADTAIAEGNYGPAALYEIMQTQEMMANSPLLRIGNRSMGAQDQWMRSIKGQQVARLRAFDELTKEGTEAFNKEAADSLADKIYKQMFNEDGVIVDEQVLAETSRATFSRDSTVSKGFQELMQRIPGLKPFFMFTRTPVELTRYGAEMNFVGSFYNKVNKFSTPFEKQPFEKVRRFLAEEGVDIKNIDQNTAANEYNRFRNMYRGASAVGMSMVWLGAYGYLSGNITGRVGLRDRKKQMARVKDYDWKPMTAFGVNYGEIPGVSDWLSMTIDVMDNTLEMEEKDAGELLRTLGYILGANFTERTQLGNIEQFNDVLSGNPAAIQRWASNITVTSQFKVAGAMGTLNQILAPQLKAVEQRMDQMILNRLPGKPGLPDDHDWIEGGAVRDIGNPLHRLYNAVSPFPYHEKPSEIKDYMIKLEMDVVPALSSRSDGVPYNKGELAEIKRIMGEQGVFRQLMKPIMKRHPVSSFKESYRDSKSEGLEPSARDVDRVRNQVFLAMQTAKRRAEAELPDLMEDIRIKAARKKGQKMSVESGDAERGGEWLQRFDQKYSR